MSRTPDGEPLVFAPGDRVRQLGIKRFLASGGSGQVYECSHLHLGGRYTLKVMHLEDAGNVRKVERAFADGKNAYRIRHANVVEVIDMDVEPTGLVWIQSEFLDGGTVAEWLHKLGGRFSPRLGLHIAAETADGLGAAHEALVIHRDVKPENVFYTSDGRVKVIDFSFARFLPDGIRTTQGRILGTPPYASPEHLRGDPLTGRADIYPLGLMVYRMLSGRHPWEDAFGNMQEMIRRHLQVDPVPLSLAARLPSFVDDVMRRMLDKDPGKRFANMAETARALRDMSAQIDDEARAGRCEPFSNPREPRIPAEPGARQQYQAPRQVPEPDAAPGMPSRRVVLLPVAPQAALGGTVPLADPAPGLAGTLPLDGGQLAAVAARVLAAGSPKEEVTSRGTAIMPQPRAPRAAEPGGTDRATPAARETAPAVIRPDDAPVPRAPASRRRVLVGIAVAVLVPATAAGAWMIGDLVSPAPAGRPPAQASAPPAASSAVTAPSASSAPPRPQAPAKKNPRR